MYYGAVCNILCMMLNVNSVDCLLSVQVRWICWGSASWLLLHDADWWHFEHCVCY